MEAVTESKDPLWPGFTLGDWFVDVSGNRLQRGEELRPLRQKAMEVLVLLARSPGQTVSREQLLQAVWQGNQFVAPKAINTAVWAIRQALGDETEVPRYLETIAKKGYRLIAPVQLLPAAEVAAEVAAGQALAPAPLEAPARAMTWRRQASWALALLLLGLALWALLPRSARAPDALALAKEAPASAAAGEPPFKEASALTQLPGVEYLGQLSPDGSQLAFAWWRGRGEGELYLKPAKETGAAPRAFSAGAGEVLGLSWSPDGRAIAYTASLLGQPCKLWVQALEGERRAIAPCINLFTPNVAWSPDGRWIAFSAELEGAGGLFLVAPDGTGLRRLSTAAPLAMADHHPAWSPDGQRLAFVRQDPADGTRDLYEAGLDGAVKRLSEMRLQFVHGISYLDDGQDLVFSTTRQERRMLLRWDRQAARALPLGFDGSAPSRAQGGGLVYALMRGHFSIARLAWHQPPERLLHAVDSARSPRYDPEGKRVAYVSHRSGSPELWLAAADGGQQRALTALGGLVSDPAWQASGEHIAFLGNCGPGKRHGLCVVPAAGGAVRPLAADAATYGRPAWHPSKPEVWVVSDRGGSSRLWRFSLDGREAEALTSADTPGRALQWMADGRSLVYQPRRAKHLLWRAMDGSGSERRIDLSATGEDLVDWRLQGSSVLALLRSDRERLRRLDLRSGRRQALGEYPLGTFPERASFDLLGSTGVLVEVANTDVADIMLAR